MDQPSSDGTAGFEIIRATPAHVHLGAPLFDAYRQFYGQAPDLDGAEAFLAARLTEGSSTVLLALSSSGTGPAALGFTQLYPSFSSVSLRPIWILNDLFIAPDARRLGVGRALLEAARDFAVASGAVRLTLQTTITNAPAQALYESLGWRRDAEFYTYVLAL